MATGGFSRPVLGPTEKCTIHQAEVINRKCRDHDVVCCAVCVAINHRSCDVVATQGNEKPQIKTIDNRSVRSATLRGQYGIKVQGDLEAEYCNINDACLIQDGYTILSDFGNKKLKLLDQTYTVVDSFTLPGWQWGMCSTGPSEIAVIVVLSYRKKEACIQFVSTFDELTHTAKLTHTRSLNVDVYCRYVALSEGKLFVTYGDKKGKVEPEVQVYSLRTGYRLRTRTIRNDKYGQKIFLNPFQIAISNDGTKIHVRDQKGLITMDREGHQSTFTDPSLEEASAICVLENDNLLVSGYKSNNVVEIDSQGKIAGEIISRMAGLEEIKSLCYDRVNSRLIVTERKKSDNIYVFDLIRK